MSKYVKGVRETSAKIRQIKPGLDVPMRAALRASSLPLLAEVKRNVPVKDGDLKKSLKLARLTRQPKGTVAYLIGPEGIGRVYAHLIEWGRFAGSTWIPGSRFMTRAFDKEAQGIVDRFEKRFPIELEKRLKYLAKKGRSL